MMNNVKLLVVGIFGLCLLHQSSSVLIVPAPTLTTQSASTTSITLNWSMPINELHDYFTLEVRIPGEPSRVINTEQMTLTVSNLVPGTLYTFVLTATRGTMTSDETVHLQETVPLPPTNLRLESFQMLTLSMHGVFGEVDFNLKVPGIQAEWQGPAVGDCDCYEATITPPDGKVARPVESDRLLPGCQTDICEAPPNPIGIPKETNDPSLVGVRKYIQLTPGQTYTIRVRSTTCGHGFLGRLKSTLINATITLPPANPPPIVPMMVTNTSAYLSWEKGELPGFYDNFEIISSSSSNEKLKIQTPINPMTRGRNVSGLDPCKVYDFEIYTLYNGSRSEESRATELFTRPSPPFNLIVSDFNETSISVRWRHQSRNQSNFFRVSVENLLTLNRPPLSNTATIPGLTPGTWHNISVAALCSGSNPTRSELVWTTQVTVPLQPEEIISECQVVNRPSRGNTGSKPFSQITLHWFPPRSGDWDGFTIDYSPFDFESYSNMQRPPLFVSRDTRSINLTLPAIGRFFTVFIRATRQHVLSESTTTNVQCRDRSGNVAEHCRARRSNFRILVNSYNETHLSIEIIGLRIENVTVQLSDTIGDVFVTSLSSFILANPCLRVFNLKTLYLIVHPLCEENRSCRPIRRKLCSNFLRDVEVGGRLFLLSNACCNEKSYNTFQKKCCHGKLAEATAANVRCCYTKWYDRTRQKCCGRNQKGGIITSIIKSCVE